MSADYDSHKPASVVAVVPQDTLVGQPLSVDPTRSSGLMVTRLMTRPKTSFAGRPTSVRYAGSSKIPVSVMGEKITPEKLRPKTCVPKGEREREREGELGVGGGKERSVPRDAKELLLPICTTRDLRLSGTQREILAIATPARRKSACGPRPLSSLLASRDRSAALLKELSLSLSLSIANSEPQPIPVDSPKDTLLPLYREEATWAGSGLGRDRRPSTSKEASESEGDADLLSPPSVKELCTNMRESRGPANGPVYLFKPPNSEHRPPPSPYTRESSVTSDVPSSGTKDSDSRSPSPCRKPSKQRYGSPGYTWPVNRTERKKRNQRSPGTDSEIRSPRIITINRTASPTRDAPPVIRVSKHKAPKSGKATRLGSKDTAETSGACANTLSAGEASLSRCSSNEKVDSASTRGASPSNVTSFDKAIRSVEEGVSPTSSAVCDTSHPMSVREDAVLSRFLSVDESTSSSATGCVALPAVVSGERSAKEREEAPTGDDIPAREETPANEETQAGNKDEMGVEVNRRSVSPRPSGSGKKTLHVSLPPTPNAESSSSTPTVPFSSSELLYGQDVSGRHGGPGQGGAGDEELGSWGVPGGDKQRLKELDVSNRRPTSRNSSSRKVASFDRVSFDRERDELRPIANSLPPSSKNPLRANGIKNNLLRVDQNASQRGNGAGRDDDLVAMGTLWSPSQLQTRGSSTTTTSSGKSTSAANSAGGGGGGQYTSGSSLTARRPINLSTTTSTRQLLYHSTTSALPNAGGMGNFVKTAKEVEPKYSDPLSGAPPTFQQRIMELAALEAETVRWERTKKVKKKPKQDRDS